MALELLRVTWLPAQNPPLTQERYELAYPTEIRKSVFFGGLKN